MLASFYLQMKRPFINGHTEVIESPTVWYAPAAAKKKDIATECLSTQSTDPSTSQEIGWEIRV